MDIMAMLAVDNVKPVHLNALPAQVERFHNVLDVSQLTVLWKLLASQDAIRVNT